MSDGAPATLSVHESSRTLDPTEIVLGGIWLGPGGGDGGDGNRPDLGQENATAAVEAALRSGICEFDTAPWYGAGASEERLGRALQALTQRGLTAATEARVVTKAGRLFREPDGTTPCLAGFDAAGRAPLAQRVCKNDYTAAGAETSLRESLQRLGLPSVFGLRVHHPNDNSLNKAGMEGFVDEVSQARWPLGLPLSACPCACPPSRHAPVQCKCRGTRLVQFLPHVVPHVTVPWRGGWGGGRGHVRGAPSAA